jgi:hypothetical protein
VGWVWSCHFSSWVVCNECDDVVLISLGTGLQCQSEASARSVLKWMARGE